MTSKDIHNLDCEHFNLIPILILRINLYLTPTTQKGRENKAKNKGAPPITADLVQNITNAFHA